MHDSGTASDLYQAILTRRSTRRYDPAPLTPTRLAEVQSVMKGIEALVPENTLHVLHRPGMLVDKTFISSMGAYGYIVSPPHALAPYLVGSRYPLVDLGFRVEQIVIGLSRLALGCCYIGTLGREQRIRDLLHLPAGARCGALLVFGNPPRSAGGKVVNRLIRSLPSGQSRLPYDQTFFRDRFDNPGHPPEDYLPLLEAGRVAPSAVNAQPWRFLQRGKRLFLFVTRHNPKYGSGANQDYRLYDAGICMANLRLALDAMGMAGQWLLRDQFEDQVPEHPETLEPIAVLQLD